MPNPNSLLTKIRINLADRFEPTPDKGEAWCIGCAFSMGRTIILAADRAHGHAEKHQTELPGTPTRLKISWPSNPEDQED